jgi:hypothetical protein
MQQRSNIIVVLCIIDKIVRLQIYGCVFKIFVYIITPRQPHFLPHPVVFATVRGVFFIDLGTP